MQCDEGGGASTSRPTDWKGLEIVPAEWDGGTVVCECMRRLTSEVMDDTGRCTPHRVYSVLTSRPPTLQLLCRIRPDTPRSKRSGGTRRAKGLAILCRGWLARALFDPKK